MTDKATDTNKDEDEDEDLEFADTEYNRRLVNVASKYLDLQRAQLQQEIANLQEGARSIAKLASENHQFPELQKICDTLDKIKIV